METAHNGFKKSMKVSDYCNKYVHADNRARFIELMEKHDGSRSVWGAFYNLGTLHMIHKEAK